MADLQLGETMSRRYRMQSDNAAHTITNIGFLPDKIIVYNETGWSTTSGISQSIFVRGMTNADALQFRNIVDNGSTSEDNTVFETTNGITITINASGVDASGVANGSITGITLTTVPVIADTAHGLANGDIIRITQIVGTIELNNRRFLVNNVAANSFELQDPETREDIDGSSMTAWSSGGRWNQLNRVDADRDVFDAETYDVTLGSAVVGADNDILWVEMFKYGLLTDLGDVA